MRLGDRATSCSEEEDRCKHEGKSGLVYLDVWRWHKIDPPIIAVASVLLHTSAFIDGVGMAFWFGRALRLTLR
jgi:hypothetical protein